ncbi:hypothetical protein ACWG0P_10835 [Amedibacillus sp. YH-ame6]
MNYKETRMEAERITFDICGCLDVDYKVKEITGQTSLNIIAGSYYVSEIEDKIARNLFHGEIITSLKNELETSITNYIVDYLNDIRDERVIAARFYYQVNGHQEVLEFENVHEVDKNKFVECGVCEPVQGGYFGIREELVGCPRFVGWVGPMWDGDAIRYESHEYFEKLL